MKNKIELMSIWNHVKIMHYRVIQTQCVAYITAAPPHTCSIQAAKDSADASSARHGENQEEEKSSTADLKISVRKLFFDEK